jgi:hypothetical protein
VLFDQGRAAATSSFRLAFSRWSHGSSMAGMFFRWYLSNLNTESGIIKTKKHVHGIALALAYASSFSLMAQNIYVAIDGGLFGDNQPRGTVGEYSTAGIVINASLISGINVPTGIGFADNKIFVVSLWDQIIGAYASSGLAVNESLITGLGMNPAMAISGYSIFVASYGYSATEQHQVGTISKYTTDGAFVGNFATPDLGLQNAIAVSGNKVFVANYYTGVISEYTTSGATINPSLISGVITPTSIAISGNDLFVANGPSGTISEYTTTGAMVNTSLISGLDEILRIVAFGNKLFVLDRGTHQGTHNFGTIGEYTTSGATVDPSLITGVGTISGLAVGPIPEPPVTAMLLITGLIGVLVRGWRRVS